MANITYLFGAGASAQSLPVVNTIPERMYQVIDLIDKTPIDSHLIFPLGQNEGSSGAFVKEKSLEQLRWLALKSSKHATIDTFAKKLWLREEKTELNTLKSALSIFLIIEQIINPIDPRYDAFFASLLTNQLRLPDTIRILSWNYDSQFELAYSVFNEVDLHLKILHKFNNRLSFNGNREDAVLFKLNGTSMFSRMGTIAPLRDKEVNILSSDSLVQLLNMFYTSDRYAPTKLSFAWEEDWSEVRVLPTACKSSAMTDVLVVIGYSFPFFNRDVDREIISSMPNLHKVYIQDPNASDIIQTFQAVTPRKDIELVPITDTRQFFLPYEL